MNQNLYDYYVINKENRKLRTKVEKELCKEYPCVEVVYMPVDDEDINEIIWKKYL